MSIILLVGVPGSGKTILANNLKKRLDEMGKDNIIVSEPSVEQGAFASSDAMRNAVKEYRNMIQHSISTSHVIIADGMNYIKATRYELFCLAREAGLGWCVAFCDCDDDLAFERSKERYKDEKRLRRIIGAMERPKKSIKADCPLFEVTDVNDSEMVDKIIKQALAKSSRLKSKKATNSCAETAHLNNNVDQIINEFVTELQKVQVDAQVGSTITIKNASLTLNRKFNTGQLKRAKREFATRAKAYTDDTQIAQLFADYLERFAH